MAGMGPGLAAKGTRRFEHFRLNPEDSRRKQPEDGGDCPGLSRETHRSKPQLTLFSRFEAFAPLGPAYWSIVVHLARISVSLQLKQRTLKPRGSSSAPPKLNRNIPP